MPAPDTPAWAADPARCAVLLVLDDPSIDPVVERFVGAVREAGATVVFAPRPARRQSRRTDELGLSLRGERLLGYALALVPPLRALLPRTRRAGVDAPAVGAAGSELVR
jgi:hypothetical protein